MKDLENELIKLNVNSKDIAEILEDHKEMIENAKVEGLSEEEITKKFGDPIKIANELHSDIEKEPNVNHNIKDSDSCVNFSTEDYNLVKTFPVTKGAIGFEVNLVSDDLQYSSYDGKDIQVYEMNIDKLGDYEIEFEKNILMLKKKKTFTLHLNDRKTGEFLVLVPNTIMHKKIEFNNVSGDANFNGVSTEKLIFKSTNGDIGLTNINAEESKFSFVNGDVEIANFRGKTFDISVINGNLAIEDGLFEGNLFFNTVSGDIELTNVECLEADLRTVSGDLNGNEFYPKEVSMKSVSGDIEITNTDKSREIKIISKKSISGSIKIN